MKFGTFVKNVQLKQAENGQKIMWPPVMNLYASCAER